MGTPIFLGGLRTPFSRAHKGAFHGVRPDDLLLQLFQEHRTRHSSLWQQAPEDLIVGCAYPEGEQGYNVARMVALGLGLGTPGMTVNRLCASSLDAAIIGAARIRAGLGQRYLVGGVESMSRVPRRGAHFSESPMIRGLSPQAYIQMGDTAEEVALKYPRIDRSAQEEFSIRSHELSDRAYASGFYRDQVVSLQGISKDDGIRFPVNREKLKSLAPAFREGGVVTAATSSPLTDGATSLWVLDSDVVDELGVEGGVTFVDAAWGHVAPEIMGMGPVPAVKHLLERNNLQARDVDAWEVNEAFAIQVLACGEELQIPTDRLNLFGGAIALGHPLGASGLRLVMTLAHRLRERGGGRGIATLCVGGGQGVAVLLQA